MIAKVVRKHKLKDYSEIEDNLAYWMSRPPGERVMAVEQLRRQKDGSSARLQRVARVVKRKPC